MPHPNKGLEPGSPIPSFTLTSVEGKVYSSKQFRGKPLLLYFLRGTWWPSCRKQLVQLRESANQYKKLGIPIVVIVGQKRDSVQKWLEKNPMPFPFLIDQEREVIKAFDVYNPINIDAFRIAHPSLFLISPEGKIIYAYVGKNQKDRPSQDETYQQVHRLLSNTLTDESNPIS